MSRLVKWFVVVASLATTHTIVFLYTEPVKDFFLAHESIANYEEFFTIQNESISNKRKHQGQVGVLIPEDLLFGDKEADLQFAKSFLSEKITWQFIDRVKLPRITGLKGIGFGFRVASGDRQVALE